MMSAYKTRNKPTAPHNAPTRIGIRLKSIFDAVRPMSGKVPGGVRLPWPKARVAVARKPLMMSGIMIDEYFFMVCFLLRLD